MVTHTTENNDSAQNVTTNTGPVFISPLHNNKSDINNIKAKDNKKNIEFMPIYSLSEWCEDDVQQKLSVCVLLPSGCTDKNQSVVSVGENLQELIVEVSCPHFFLNVFDIHSKSESLQSNHPKLIGFHKFFQKFRIKNTDPVIAKAIISLPFEVQKNLNSVKRFGDKAGCRLIYVELLATKTSDYKDVDCDDFVLM